MLNQLIVHILSSMIQIIGRFRYELAELYRNWPTWDRIGGI